MTSPVSEQLRRLVRSRAQRVCEYCLIHEDDTFFGCEVDHIISQKHGGPTEPDNLAYACLPCNRQKGSDVASIHWPTGEIVRLFHPRRDRWPDHFVLEGAIIVPETEIGEATARILQLNTPDRILEQLLHVVLSFAGQAALLFPQLALLLAKLPLLFAQFALHLADLALLRTGFAL